MYTVPNQKTIICDSWEGNVPPGMKFSIHIRDIHEETMLRLSGKAFKQYHYWKQPLIVLYTDPLLDLSCQIEKQGYITIILHCFQ